MSYWGPEIRVDGVRPAWLSGRVVCDMRSAHGWCYTDERAAHKNDAEAWCWSHGDGEPNITAIRLPADHFAYRAIGQGFTPWAGGDAAPEDWDGNLVLYRYGRIENWNGSLDPRWSHEGNHFDIIGYQRKEETVADIIREAGSIFGPDPYTIGSDRWPGLSKLIEEAGEVIQVGGKLLGSGGSADLRVMLVEEIGDLYAALDFFVDKNLRPDRKAIESRRERKQLAFQRWHRENGGE